MVQEIHSSVLKSGLSYTDVRRFKMPSTAGAVDDCTLVRHYLSNSHKVDLRPPDAHFSFVIKMLASLAARNFSVGSLELDAEAERLSDYRSMDVVFGGLRISDLYLSCEERRFVELVKTTDFFRMSTVQGLRVLKLTLRSWNEEEESTGHAGSKSPLWVLGICLLRNCKLYRVNYVSKRHLRLIGRKARICEEFERGEITDTVEHFQFSTNSSGQAYYAFNEDNLLISGMKVDGDK